MLRKIIVEKSLTEYKEKNDKHYNVILTGIEDTDSTDRNLFQSVQNVIDEISRLSHRRIAGNIVTGNYIGRYQMSQNRPIRITLDNPHVAQVIIDSAHVLKDSEIYKGVYISPDRTLEEQRKHNELHVKKLKEKICQ